MSVAVSEGVYERNWRLLRETLVRLGFAYDEKRKRWLGHGVEVVVAEVTWRCARPWLVVRRRGMEASIYVKWRFPTAKVEYNIDGEARPSEKDVVEFYTLAVKLLDEVSKIEPRC